MGKRSDRKPESLPEAEASLPRFAPPSALTFAAVQMRAEMARARQEREAEFGQLGREHRHGHRPAGSRGPEGCDGEEGRKDGPSALMVAAAAYRQQVEKVRSLPPGLTAPPASPQTNGPPPRPPPLPCPFQHPPSPCPLPLADPLPPLPLHSPSSAHAPPLSMFRFWWTLPSLPPTELPPLAPPLPFVQLLTRPASLKNIR